MASPNFNYERAASAIADLQMMQVSEVAEKYDVSRSTVYRWKRREEEDKKLQQLANEKRELVREKWAEKIPSALEKGLEFMEEAFEELSRDDPEALYRVAGAYKLIFNSKVFKDHLDAKRTRRRLREEAAEGGDGGNVYRLREAGD